MCIRCLTLKLSFFLFIFVLFTNYSFRLYFLVTCNTVFYIWESAFLKNYYCASRSYLSICMSSSWIYPPRKDKLPFYHLVGCFLSWSSLVLTHLHFPLSSWSAVYISVTTSLGYKMLWIVIIKSTGALWSHDLYPHQVGWRFLRIIVLSRYLGLNALPWRRGLGCHCLTLILSISSHH